VARHVLTAVDPEARTAICSVCGPRTRVYAAGRRGGGRWRCRNRVRGQASIIHQPRTRNLTGDAQTRHRVMRMRASGIDITVEQYLALVEAQAGRCALCGVEAETVVDHDHDTGKVRGLLCRACNAGLGCFGDDPAALDVAAEYLRSHHGG